MKFHIFFYKRPALISLFQKVHFDNLARACWVWPVKLSESLPICSVFLSHVNFSAITQPVQCILYKCIKTTSWKPKSCARTEICSLLTDTTINTSSVFTEKEDWNYHKQNYKYKQLLQMAEPVPFSVIHL